MTAATKLSPEKQNLSPPKAVIIERVFLNQFSLKEFMKSEIKLELERKL
ncbi:hypothetical protein [Paenibacillus ehimensis]|uniref:Uncharacterized protein n=1 Tax=Paenibacillus ehimensis TaxID=79264 RepID=A0ABT8VFD8_9BACL|nr:hypothetical protein [Paenibacillus ehimensis]MDO3679674.1 hypothetical protein [Paenibacillus ehimensis]